MKTLTKKEQKENVFLTLGRLKAAIQYGKPLERQLALLSKITLDVSNMDIEIPVEKRVIF